MTTDDVQHEVEHVASPAVLVVSRVRLLREYVAQTLGLRGIRVITATPDTLPAPQLADGISTDAAVIDARDPFLLASVQKLTASVPPLKVLLYGTLDDEQTIVRCIEAGATGYIDADCSEEELCIAVQRVRCDDVIMTPQLLATLMRRVTSGPAASSATSLEHLTMRERQVLGLMERGLSNKEIAGDLNISLATVKHHVHRILEKLKVPRRSAAVAQLRGHQPPPP